MTSMTQPPRQYPPSENKTAIVTGGSQGIGRATALCLARAGWNVVISARNGDKLAEAQRYITAQLASTATGPAKNKIETFQGDMTVEKDVEAMFDVARQRCSGAVDLIFINAGMSGPNVPLQQLNLDDWTSVVNVNLTGAWLCAREAFRHMDGTHAMGGRIVLNGSISAHAPRPNSSAYTATKHAISGLTKSLALDGRKYNIAVTQLDIGNAVSAMTEGMGAGAMQADGSVRAEPRMDVEHAARQVVHVAEMPLEANVLNITVMATNMPSHVARG